MLRLLDRIPRLSMEMCLDASARFWSKVKKTDDCWEWGAARNRKGYGDFYLKGSMRKAHRVSWVMEHGEIEGGLMVCHHCDNPSCVRPDHLFLGTARDNEEDSRQKGRTVKLRGELHGNSKMTPLSVRIARRLYFNHGFSFQKVSDIWGLNVTTMWDIVMSNTWKHIPPV